MGTMTKPDIRMMNCVGIRSFLLMNLLKIIGYKSIAPSPKKRTSSVILFSVAGPETASKFDIKSIAG